MKSPIVVMAATAAMAFLLTIPCNSLSLTNDKDTAQKNDKDKDKDDDDEQEERRRKAQIREFSPNSVATERIVNGRVATKGAYPFFAQRWAGAERGIFQGCGGTLIATKWVLSAAHCVPKLTKPQWRIGGYCNRPDNELGVNCGVPFELRQSIRTLAHPRYNPEIEIWDFALFELNEHVHNLPPATIDDSGVVTNQLQRGDLMRLVGFGHLNDVGNEPNVLQEVDNLFLPFEECFRRFRNGQFFDESVLCSNGENFGPCQGDSGSPVLVRRNDDDGDGKTGGLFVLVGLNSFGGGSTCENHNHPDVAAKVVTALPWIRAVICPTYRGPNNAPFRPHFCPPPPAPPTPPPPPLPTPPPTPAPQATTTHMNQLTPQESTVPSDDDKDNNNVCAQDKSVRFQFWGRRNQFDKQPRCKKIKTLRQALKFCNANASNALDICKGCRQECQDFF